MLTVSFFSICIYGGGSRKDQIHWYRQDKPEIVVATPGRLDDLVMAGIESFAMIDSLLMKASCGKKSIYARISCVLVWEDRCEGGGLNINLCSARLLERAKSSTRFQSFSKWLCKVDRMPGFVVKYSFTLWKHLSYRFLAYRNEIESSGVWEPYKAPEELS